MNELKVSVVNYKDRPHLVLRWVDPETGRTRTRSAKTTRRREAERAAGKLQADLEAGKLTTTGKISWDDFRERYESVHVASLAERTGDTVFTSLNTVGRLCNPQRLSDLTAQRIAAFQAKLREEGNAEATVAAYSRTLKAALNWAVDMGMLANCPKIRMPKRAKVAKMKGRPITTEEYERMLAVTPSIVGDPVAASWRHYLEGLWWSGLRLSESLQLYWDRTDKLAVDLTGRRPMLRIPGSLEKGGKDRLLAMAPEFAEFIERTPIENRKGRVFKLGSPSGRSGWSMRPDTVSKIVAKIGKRANVKVEETTRMGKLFIKYASAHDLRRSFGERWAMRVLPQVLMELMRHESISTTMSFYVGQDAERTADVLWKAIEAKKSTIPGNIDESEAKRPNEESPQNPSFEGSF